jgi:fumarylpyruvate hydrolase
MTGWHGIIVRRLFDAFSPLFFLRFHSSCFAACLAARSAMTDVITVPLVPRVPVQGGGEFPVHRIYCVGRNYADHAVEMGHDARESPFFFLKPADAVLAVRDGEEGTMDYPTLTSDLHHEIELVVAIGDAAAGNGRDVAEDETARLIFGYAVGLDMTRRDLQAQAKKSGRPWSIAKGFEQSAPISAIRRIEETGELTAGAITLEVDGVARQKGDLSDMIWNVRETLAWLSRAWTLRPGDLVFTGTPAGVGGVTRGQRLHGRIHGVGELRLVLR